MFPVHYCTLTQGICASETKTGHTVHYTFTFLQFSIRTSLESWKMFILCTFKHYKVPLYMNTIGFNLFLVVYCIYCMSVLICKRKTWKKEPALQSALIFYAATTTRRNFYLQFLTKCQVAFYPLTSLYLYRATFGCFLLCLCYLV
jgi:hypothetical protein